MKKVVSYILVLCLLMGLCACGGGGKNSLIDPDTGTIYPDHWYHHNEITGLSFKNVIPNNPFLKNSGGVYVPYYPICSSCHQQGTLSSCIVTMEESFQKGYYCDCGGQTAILIQYNP